MGNPTLLGYDEEGSPSLISGEEKRLHLDIFGAPGQGKSRLIELLMRQDIRNGYGCCLLDPSENGDTVNRMLAFCESIGFDKVCLINPPDFKTFDRIPIFNPLKYRHPAEVNAGNVMDALSVLWSSGFEDKLGFLNLATSLLALVHKTKYTLPDIEYFLDPIYVRQRAQILKDVSPSDSHRRILESSKSKMAQEAVANRFSVFYKDQWFRLMLGSKKFGINFKQLIRDGYVILVNLDPQGVWGSQVQQRLLGTLIINEITQAIFSLRESGKWSSAFYLYIDEMSDYATAKIAYILDKKRKTGLSFTVAHQRLDQIKDTNIRSSVRGSTSNKFLFHTLNQDDRMTMIKDMGFENPAEWSHRLRGLRVQEAAVSIGKSAPKIITLETVEDIHISPALMRSYKRHIYSQYFYRRSEEINKEINARLDNRSFTINPTEQPGEPGDRRAPKDRRRLAGGPAVPDRRANGDRRQRSPKRRPVKTAYSEEE